jgi:hypothetical protein
VALTTVLLSCFLVGLSVQASDPLDDNDGTEGWDQVVQPEAAKPQPPPTAPSQDDFRKEIADWESIRQTWEQEREGFVRERATHKRLATMTRPSGGSSAVLEINDSNLQQATQADEDWGDSPGEQWLVPTSSVDRAIDEELSETRPASAPVPAPAPPPTALMPPSLPERNEVPSAFKQSERRDLGGGLAPTSPNPDAPLPPAPTAAKKVDASDGAKAAAEMMRKQQEEDRKRQEAERAQREKEAAEGAAAAAKLLEMQAEQERKEQEALRKKAGVKVDDDGQMVDPDLQREMDEEEEPGE